MNESLKRSILGIGPVLLDLAQQGNRVLCLLQGLSDLGLDLSVTGRHPMGSQELVLGLVATNVGCLLSIVGTLNLACLELLLFETHAQRSNALRVEVGQARFLGLLMVFLLLRGFHLRFHVLIEKALELQRPS